MLQPNRTLLITVFSVFVSILHFSGRLHVNCALPAENDFIRAVFKSYRKIPPAQELGLGTTIVQMGIYINSFDSISEQEMDFEISIYLRQNWSDPRLAYENEPMLRNRTYIKLEDAVHEKIWLPDIYFRNEKAAKFHSVTVPNRLLRIYPDGRIWSVSKITATLSCPMHLKKYPLDTQIGYHPSVVEFRFLEGKDPVEKADNLQPSQFELLPEETKKCTETANTCLKIEFHLRRKTGFYMVEVYVPTILIVIMSWITFWIHADAIPARTSIGLLTVLTMTTKSSAAGASLPKVSYIKAIDVWMSTCLIFVFASLLEFAVVHVLARRYAQEQQMHQQAQAASPAISPTGGRPSSGTPRHALEAQLSGRSKGSTSDIEMRLLSAADEKVTDITLRDESSMVAMGSPRGSIRLRQPTAATAGPSAEGSVGSPMRRSSFTPMMPLEDFALTPGAAEQVPMIDSQPPEVTQLSNVPVATPCPHDPGAPYHLCQRCLTCRRRAPAFQAVDQFSRAFFPILFILFNAAYWIFYLVILP